MTIYKRWYNVLLFIAPALILFTLVVAVPFFIGIVYSFTAWRGTYFVGGDHFYNAFVGFDNYVKALNNPKFISAFKYTVEYTFLAVITITTFSLIIALVLDRVTKGVGIFRTTYFLPNLLGGLALGFIWQFIFQIVFTNFIFKEGGMLDIEFFRYMTQDTFKALFALVIMTTWQYAGYMMIIFTTGINNISEDIYEAAEIDGSSRMNTIRKITIPMLMPSFTVVVFLNLANSFKLLDQNLALTDGNFDTRMLALQILRTVKDGTTPDYGQAQAQAVIFFIVVSAITLTQVYFTKKREVEL